jgi:hypothetical protein
VDYKSSVYLKVNTSSTGIAHTITFLYNLVSETHYMNKPFKILGTEAEYKKALTSPIEIFHADKGTPEKR